MLKVNMKTSAYMGNRKEGGFTLIQTLFSVIIIFTVTPLLTSFLLSLSFDSNYTDIAIDHFFTHLRNEMLSTNGYSIDNNKLLLHQDDGTIASISLYEQLIRRQIDGRGHEIYLRDVESISFKPLRYGVRAKVTTLEGDTYEKAIVFYE